MDPLSRCFTGLMALGSEGSEEWDRGLGFEICGFGSLVLVLGGYAKIAGGRCAGEGFLGSIWGNPYSRKLPC